MMSAKPEQVNTITLIYLNHFGVPAFSQARWFNRTEVTEMGKKENKKDKEQSDQKKSPPTDSSVRVIGQKRKR
jgi:hypothetical protein